MKTNVLKGTIMAFDARLPASVATGLLEETAHRGDTAIQNDQFE